VIETTGEERYMARGLQEKEIRKKSFPILQEKSSEKKKVSVGRIRREKRRFCLGRGNTANSSGVKQRGTRKERQKEVNMKKKQG